MRYRLSETRIFFQGRDAKARNWAAHFREQVVFFTASRDLLHVLRSARRGDVVIFRYQNNKPSLPATLVQAALVLLTVARTRLARITLVWICHNVDQDTSIYFKRIERLRRAALMRFADVVLVLDSAFLPYVARHDARVISFGEKRDGAVLGENRARIAALADNVDRLILIAGQDNRKYKSFARIPEVAARFAEEQLQAGFIVAGMDPDRRFTPQIEARLLRIDEPNLRESELTAHVDFIYRENADISVPYTIYAAATAKIPVLTRRGNILERILQREGIGMCLDEDIVTKERRYDFVGFLERNKWDSLSKTLRDIGVPV